MNVLYSLQVKNTTLTYFDDVCPKTMLIENQRPHPVPNENLFFPFSSMIDPLVHGIFMS